MGNMITLQAETIVVPGSASGIAAAADEPISRGFLSDSPDASTQSKSIAMLRRLAENGVLYARLMGRDLLPVDSDASGSTAKTVGDLLCLAMADMQLGVLDGDKEAQARRKGRAVPTEVMQALVG